MENYTITKQQILELHESNSPETRTQIAKMFPDAFKKELEVNRWYSYNNCLVCYQGDINNLNTGFGFFSDKSWMNLCNLGYEPEKWIESTPKEIETALRDEAKKRGFVKGAKYKPLFSGGFSYDTVFEIESDKFRFHGQELLTTSKHRIFTDGKWAEIIPEETKQITMDKAIKILSKKYGKKVEINL